MTKTSVYKKKDYVLTFGADDVLFFDIEVKVKESNPTCPFYELEIVSCQLAAQMEFLRHVVNLLTTEDLRKLNEEIKENLIRDLTETGLHNIFYSGDVIPNEF